MRSSSARQRGVDEAGRDVEADGARPDLARLPPAQRVLALQRMAGNRAVAQMLARNGGGAAVAHPAEHEVDGEPFPDGVEPPEAAEEAEASSSAAADIDAGPDPGEVEQDLKAHADALAPVLRGPAGRRFVANGRTFLVPAAGADELAEIARGPRWSDMLAYAGERAWAGAKAVGSAVWGGAKAVAGAAWEGTKTIGAKAWEGTKALGNAAWEGTKTVGAKAWEGVQAAWQGAKTLAVKGVTAAGKGLGRLYDRLATGGRWVIEKVTPIEPADRRGFFDKTRSMLSDAWGNSRADDAGASATATGMARTRLKNLGMVAVRLTVSAVGKAMHGVQTVVTAIPIANLVTGAAGLIVDGVALAKSVGHALRLDKIRQRTAQGSDLGTAIDAAARQKKVKAIKRGIGMVGTILGISAAAALLASNPAGWALGLTALIIGGGMIAYKLYRSRYGKRGHVRQRIAEALLTALAHGDAEDREAAAGTVVELGLTVEQASGPRGLELILQKLKTT